MSKIEIINIGGNSIRAQEVEGELYYVLTDVFICLGYISKDTGRLSISPINKTSLKISTPSGTKHCTGANASGIKEFLLSSIKQTNI